MKTLFQHTLCSFHLLHSTQVHVLLFNWTNHNATMQYNDFKMACHNFAGFAWQYQIQHLIVNTTNFVFTLPNTFNSWQENELNPRYHHLGVQKFAYIVTANQLPFMQDIPAENNRFATKNFTNLPFALGWINE